MAGSSRPLSLIFIVVVGCVNLTLWMFTMRSGLQSTHCSHVTGVESMQHSTAYDVLHTSAGKTHVTTRKEMGSPSRKRELDPDGPSKVLAAYTPLTPNSILQGVLPVQVPGLRVYVHSAIANHHRPLANKLNVVLNVWDGYNGSLPFICCLTTADGALMEVRASRVHFYPKGELQSSQFNCPANPEHHYIKVSFSKRGCDDEDRSPWLPVTYPKPGTLALCAKVAFGDIDPEPLVEWFELQRLLGVTKVLLFVLGDLSTAARQVLNYYSLDGFAQVLPLLLPPLGNETKIRGFKFWSRGPGTQFFSDEQTAVYDCQERLSQHRFLAVHDLDEVIVAEGANKSLPALLENLKQKRKDSACFVFMSENFVTDWGVGDRNTSLTLLRYVWRTEAMGDHVKTVQIPALTRVTHTHNAEPKPGFAKHWVSKQIATLHHYRSCKHQYNKCRHFKRFKDTTLKSLEKRLLKNVNRVPVFIRKPKL